MQRTQDGADNTLVEDDLFVSDSDEDFLDQDDSDDLPINAKKQSARRQGREGSTSRSAKGRSVDKKSLKRASSSRSRDKSSSGESFDFDISESEPSPLRRRCPRPKVSSPLVSPGLRKQSAKENNVESVRRSPGRPRKGVFTARSDELGSLNSNSEADGGPPRKTGLLRNNNSPGSSVQLPDASSTSKSSRKGKAKASDTQDTFTMNDIRAALASIDENQSRGLSSGFSSTSTHSDHTDSPIKRQRGRPRKSSSVLALSPTTSCVSDGLEEPAKRKPGRPPKARSPSSEETGQSRTSSRDLGIFSPDIEMSETGPRLGDGKTKDNLAATEEIPSIGTITIKRGRPRNDVSTLPSGRSRQDSLITSSTLSSPEILKRRPGRPRHIPSPPLIENDTPPETPVCKRRRPRKKVVSPPLSDDIILISESDSPKRKPEHPRKDKIPPRSISNNITTSTLPMKQTAGRTSKDSFLIPSTSSTKSQPGITTISSRNVIRTHSTMGGHSSSSSGESFDFTGLSDSDASDEDFELFLARMAKRLKTQRVSPVVKRPLAKFRDVAVSGDLRCDSRARGTRNLPIVVISD